MAKGGGGGEGQQPQSDTSLNLLWTVAVVIAIPLILWYFERDIITKIIFHIRYYEIIFIDTILYGWSKIAPALQLPTPSAKNLFAWAEYMHSNYNGVIPFNTLIQLSTAVGYYLRFPVASVLAILAAILYFGGVAKQYRNVYNVKDFRQVEQKNWPFINPILRLDLVNTPLDEEPWAIAPDPMRFCKANNLIRLETKDGKLQATLRRGAAHRLLSLQLGPRWKDIDSLPMYLKALFAVFAARIDLDKKSADKLVATMAMSATGTITRNSINYANTLELLEKHRGNKHVQEITKFHGYVTTVMASMLATSREAGVLATSEFLWLKAIDRRMWYMLNSVGRPAATSEICGAYAHWLCEKKLGLPLAVPMVDEGVRGLEIALNEIIYKPEKY